jgi:hypothetical protein
MSEIIGGIAVIIVVIGIYVYYGRMVFNFVRRQIGTRQFLKHQKIQKAVDSMTEEDLKKYGAWMKDKIEKDEDDKRKGIFRF